MTTANDLATRAKAVTEKKVSAVVAADTGTAASPRVKPVRLTIDVSPQAHRALKGYCHSVSERHGRARTPHADVLRVLLDLLDTDTTLQEQVERELNRKA